MAVRESSIQASIIKFLKKLPNTVVVNNHGSAYAGSGRPDLFACVKGTFVAIEVKRPGEAPTLLQAAELAKLRQAGAVVGVARSVADVKRILQEAGLPYEKERPEADETAKD